MKMITYRHKNGKTRFRQNAADPLPAWAVDVKLYHAPKRKRLYFEVALSVPLTAYRGKVSAEQWMEMLQTGDAKIVHIKPMERPKK